jgi:hypothetical protein
MGSVQAVSYDAAEDKRGMLILTMSTKQICFSLLLVALAVLFACRFKFALS